MLKEEFYNLAKDIAKEEGFVIDSLISEADATANMHLRNMIISGKFQDKSAILKLYDDKWVNYEPEALKAFHKKNASEIISAPELYRYELISPKSGWLIMEKLPDDGYFYKSPVSAKDKKEIMRIFAEIKKIFPAEAWKPLDLFNRLPAHEYHRARLGGWFMNCSISEEERKVQGLEPLYRPEDIISRYNRGMKIIDREFTQRQTEWIHGHIKSSELFRHKDGQHFSVIDFGHVKMYPQGYDFAFIVWMDVFMEMKPYKDYEYWRKLVQDWIDLMDKPAAEMKIENFQQLLRASLIERLLGTILEDVPGMDMAYESKKKVADYYFTMFDEFADAYEKEN